MNKSIRFRNQVMIFLISLSQLLTAQEYRFLIGTYTDPGKSKGIYSCTWKTGDDSMHIESVTAIPNPSFLAFSPDRRYVYSVSEGSNESAAFSYKFNKNNGELTFLNRSLTQGKGPCHILATEKNVFTANYVSGSFTAFGRKQDGSLTNALQIVQHTGKSINIERQGEPHVHEIILSPDGKFILTNDLGTDYVTVYRYNKKGKRNIVSPFDSLKVKPGSGPRHGIFNKSGNILYLVHEIDGTVSVIGYHNGHLKLLQETTVDRAKGTVDRAAEIELSADGKFLYVSNRGSANNISCFAVQKDGRINLVQQIASGGDGPRNFAITPDGKYVFVAHQFTDNIVVFHRDSNTGKLASTETVFHTGAPVCLLFY